jgi:galactitol-specific phosphotransferase system IIC component
MLATYLFFVPTTLCSVGLEVIVPEGEILPLGDLTALEVKTATGHTSELKCKVK